MGEKMQDLEGIKFLNRLYKKLNNSEEVNNSLQRSENNNELDEYKKDYKNYKVKTYLNRLERIHESAIYHNNLDLLKSMYYDKYVIKPENVPESYFELQKRIAFERGLGRIEINRKEAIKTIIEDQKYSLDIWLDYLLNEDTNIYPSWFKYYAFQGMLKLGEFDKTNEKFSKRTNKTIVKFIDLNREALSLTYDTILKLLSHNNIEEGELEPLVNSGSFERIYTYFIKKIDSNKKNITSSDGIWRTFKQGSDPSILVSTLEGKGTGWCTAGIETARTQLSNGDFHIYYTKDEQEDYIQPRIAIRMENNIIAEIRGIAEHQNLESEMESILNKKLEEFPDKDNYLKKTSDMEMLTSIYKEYKIRELSIEELKFLYEIDNKIQGFGYCEDPRIKEIINNRNFKSDLSKALNCSEIEISDNTDDIINGNKIVYFYGNLDLKNLTSVKNLKLPKYINGFLNLYSLTNPEGLVLPKYIGYLDLASLTSVKDLILPEYVDGNFYLSSLTNPEGLVLPKYIDGDLDLVHLTSAEGLILPEYIDGSLNLDSLTSLDGLIIPENFNLGGRLFSSYFTKEDLLNRRGQGLNKNIEENEFKK